jgi:hypothetical protein
MARDQRFERPEIELAETFALRRQPYLEVGRIGQAETVEQQTAIQVDRRLELIRARRSSGCQALEGAHVRPDLIRQPQPVDVRLGEYLVAEGFADGPQRVAQILAGRLGQTLRPEQRDHVLARLGSAPDRQVRQERRRLGGAQLDRPAVRGKLSRPQQEKAQFRHTCNYMSNSLPSPASETRPPEVSPVLGLECTGTTTRAVRTHIGTPAGTWHGTGAW